MKREKNNNKNNNLETIILAERIQKVEEVTRRREKNAYGKSDRAITLIALIVTTIFSYDENVKFSNNKGFLLQTI